MKLTRQQVAEFFIEKLILLCGVISILFVVLIFVFLLKEGLSLFSTVKVTDFLFGKAWYPVSEPSKFGILSLIMGSLWVTFGAIIISVPIGIASAIYIAEIAHPKVREILKAGIEMLAAIPSVVIGFIGITTLVPLVRNVFHLSTGLTVLSGSIMLAFMAVPTIVSVTEDAFYSIPKRYKEAALALGATHWQTIWRVLIRAAFPGIVAACMLGIGRVIGETIAVLMVTGNVAKIPHSFADPARTLTATIAAEMGEAVRGSDHYFSLFAIGIVLFIITFLINLISDIYLNREIK